jgi:hypothetical protein
MFSPVAGSLTVVVSGWASSLLTSPVEVSRDGMGGAAGRFRRASLEKIVETGVRIEPESWNRGDRRQDRIEDDAADGFGVLAHERLRKEGAV